MKSFEEFLAGEDDMLEEGVIRTGAIATYGCTDHAKKARTAVQGVQEQGQETLRRGSGELTAEERLGAH